MCTLAWGSSGDQFWVCFNRDEQRTRAVAEQPQLHETPAGTTIAYPRDPDGGGTWCGVSSAGFVLGLLNYYPEEGAVVHRGARSRGLLVRELLECESASGALSKLVNGSKTDFSPFDFFILTPDSVCGLAWDGSSLTFLRLEDSFWTTSSHRQESVRKWRRSWFRTHASKAPDDPAAIARLLRKPRPVDPAFGLTMDRDDARTVSQLLIQGGAGEFSVEYRPRDPDGVGYLAPARIAWST